MICDADLQTINTVIKWPGSVHGARILPQSAVYQAFEEQAPLAGYHDFRSRDSLAAVIFWAVIF